MPFLPSHVLGEVVVAVGFVAVFAFLVLGGHSTAFCTFVWHFRGTCSCWEGKVFSWRFLLCLFWVFFGQGYGSRVGTGLSSSFPFGCWFCAWRVCSLRSLVFLPRRLLLCCVG